jgi:hypothetical protein
MLSKKRIAPVVLAVAIGAGGLTIPAGAATTTHWTTKQCTSYAKRWAKSHKHATAKQKKAADKTLKKHGCSNKVK